MAEERNLVPSGAPATAAADTDATKQELQRRMEEAREQISQTVTEIKETVVNQYQQVRTSINDSLDWREQFRRRPVPFAAGAFGAGLVLGYAVGGAFGDDKDDYDEENEESFARIESGFDQLRTDTARKPYAASPILGQAASFGTSGGGTGAAPSQPAADVGPETRPSYSDEYRPAVAASESSTPASGQGSVGAGFGSFSSSGGASGGGETAAAEEAPKGPSLFGRFKETKAYDRLQDELTSVGERVVEELSKTAQTVVIPALLNKLKDMIGIDLGTQRQVVQRTKLETQTAEGHQATQDATGGGQTSGGGSGQQGSAGGSANFATGGRGA
ncbi:MAG TPA: hypothetical protein VEY09_00540 [Pyrinomonadaceae bacterium]|nr:hypothetical protein [Pyrinomonadaceae bacterium]